MSNSQNLLVNVVCPHCGKPLLAAVSGFAGQLASRVKVCKFCEKEYHVHLLSTTSIVDSPSDGEIAAMKSNIQYFKEQRKITVAELLIKSDLYKKLYNEALDTAIKQRSNFQSN